MGVRSCHCEKVGSVLFVYFDPECGLVDGLSWPLNLGSVESGTGANKHAFVVVVWLNYGVFRWFVGQCM